MNISNPLKRDRKGIVAARVLDEPSRQGVIEILAATYQREKGWVANPAEQIPPGDLTRSDVSWFLARSRNKPVGALRVHYAPSLEQYASYGFKMIDPNFNVEDFLRRARIAEVGRFCVLPESRGGIAIVAALMRSVTHETVERGFTHLITDVFEGDPHSPYNFHTRVLGFRPVATHDRGELNTDSKRITLLLDIKAAYRSLSAGKGWLFRYLTDEWDASMHRRLVA